MAKRCIYFVRNNQLYKRTANVEWDMDDLETSVRNCNIAFNELLLPFMEPCINVSTGSEVSITRNMATCFVKDDDGSTVKSLWKKLDLSIGMEFIPPGAHDLLYITSLSEEQVLYTLGMSSFCDSFHNPDKYPTCSAKALASLKLLYMQNKVEYIEDMNKFLWWYWANCQYPLEYIKECDK